MDKLENNWLTDGLIDFEYKKYILLAYLKNIRQNFRVNKLYPFLSDLINHYQHLKRLQKDKIELSNQFPVAINLKEFMAQKLKLERLIKDDEISQELEDIMVFSMDKMLDTMKTGKEIYDIVEGNMEIIPIGLSSIYQNEGYMFIDHNDKSSIHIYRYRISVFKSPEDKYRAIHATLIDRMNKSIVTTYEQMRLKLIKRNKDLPNPATYLINSKYTYPLMETVLPVAKRLLVRYVNAA
jgi:hypothetical protein